MFSKKGYFIGVFIIVFVLKVHADTASDKLNNLNKLSDKEVVIILTPSTCVALRKGRKCFCKVNISWKVPEINNYCLRRNHDKKIIHCWQQTKSAQFIYNFASETEEVIELMIDNTNHKGDTENKDNTAIILGSATIKINWVYKTKRKKSRWRPF